MSTRTDFPHCSRTSEDNQQRSATTRDLLSRASATTGRERHDHLEQVVLLHLDVADALAHRYRDRGAETADLEQVARLALVEAAERADPDRGDFLPFAVSTIRGCLKRHFRDQCWVVRPPRRVQGLQAEIGEAWSALAQELGRCPTNRDLATRVARPTTEIGEARAAGSCYRPVSLDAPLRSDDTEGAAFASLLGHGDAGYESAEWIKTLRAACEELGNHDRRMLYLRFFEECTQQEIADELGGSQMQVSRSLRRVLAFLHDRLDDEPSQPLPEAA